MDRPTQVASVFAAIGADLSGLNSGLRESREKLGGFQGFMQKTGQSVSKVGRSMALGVTMPLIGMGAMMVKEAAEYESGLKILEMASKGTGTGIEELDRASIKIGGDIRLMGIDAFQASEGITELFKAGRTTTQVFGDLGGYLAGTVELSGDLRAAIDLQAASELDLAAASDLVAVSQSVWSKEGLASIDIANSLVKTADASAASVSDLAASHKTAGPTLAAFNWTLGDTNTALALMTDRGIRGEEAGTGLRSMMTNLQRDTKKTNEAYDELGVALYDQEGQMKRMPDFLGKLGSALEGLTEEQRNYYVQTLAGTYGQNTLNALLAAGSEGWQEMETRIDAASSATEVAEKRTEGFQGGLEALRGVVQTFLIGAGKDFLEKFATPAVVKLTGIVSALNELDPAVLATGIKFAGIAAAIGPALLLLGGLVRVLGLLPLPVWGVVIPLGLLAGALFLSSDAGGELRKGMRDLGAELSKKEGLAGLGAWITKLSEILDLVAKFEPFWKLFGMLAVGPGFFLIPKAAAAITEKGQEIFPPTLGTAIERFPSGPSVADPERQMRAVAEARRKRWEEAYRWREELAEQEFGPGGYEGEYVFPHYPPFPSPLLTPVPEAMLREKGKKAISAYVGGAQDLLGPAVTRTPGMGDAAIVVPVGVSSQTDQIEDEGKAAGRAYARAFKRGMEEEGVGGLAGTSVLAAARARGQR